MQVIDHGERIKIAIGWHVANSDGTYNINAAGLDSSEGCPTDDTQQVTLLGKCDYITISNPRDQYFNALFITNDAKLKRIVFCHRHGLRSITLKQFLSFLEGKYTCARGTIINNIDRFSVGNAIYHRNSFVAITKKVADYLNAEKD